MAARYAVEGESGLPSVLQADFHEKDKTDLFPVFLSLQKVYLSKQRTSMYFLQFSRDRPVVQIQFQNQRSLHLFKDGIELL